MMIFIVGNSRSGTTMMGRVLGRHPDIHTFGELHFFEQEVDRSALTRRSSLPDAESIGLIERLMTRERDGFFAPYRKGKYENEARVIFESLQKREPASIYRTFLEYEIKKNGKKIPCEQTPKYLYYMREILDLYPDAKIICMVRDPRSVLLSQKNKWRRRFLGARNIPLRESIRAWLNYHPYTISLLWKSAVNTIENYKYHPRVKIVHFEEFILSPSRKISDVCNFLEIDFEESMLSVPQVGSSTGEDAPDRRGIAKDRATSWMKGGLSPAEIKICEKVCAKEMVRWGYAPVQCVPSILTMLGWWILFPFKSMLALMVNIKRSRNLLTAVRIRLSGWHSGSAD